MNAYVKSLGPLERLMFTELTDRVVHMSDDIVQVAGDRHAWSRLIMLADMAGIPCGEIATGARVSLTRVNDWKAGGNDRADLFAEKVVRFLQSRVLQGKGE